MPNRFKNRVRICREVATGGDEAKIPEDPSSVLVEEVSDRSLRCSSAGRQARRFSCSFFWKDCESPFMVSGDGERTMVPNSFPCLIVVIERRVNGRASETNSQPDFAESQKHCSRRICIG